MLKKDVQVRYSNAQDVINDLRLCQNQEGNDAQALIQQLLIQERNAELEDDISISKLYASTNKVIDENELYFHSTANLENNEKQERVFNETQNSDFQNDSFVEDFFEDDECTEIDTVVPKIHQIFGREQIIAKVTEQLKPRRIVWIHGQKGIGKSLLLKEIHSQNVNSQYIDSLYLQGSLVSADTWYTFLHNNLLPMEFRVSQKGSQQQIKETVQKWCRASERFVVIIDSLSVQYYSFICELCSLSPNITWVVGALSCPILLPNGVTTEVNLLSPLSEEISYQLIISHLPDDIREKLHSEHTDITQEEQSQITSLKEKIQICRIESHGIPLLLIQNAKALHEEKKQLQQHINKVRETYFNDIQVRFEQQSPEAQSVFAQASIIESAFDLDTVEAIASLNTMKSNYWLMDALEELLRSSFLSLQEHRFFIPPLLRKFANRFLNVEIHFNAQLYHAQYFSQFAFLPYADKNFNLDNFVEKRDAVEKDIQMAFQNAFTYKWNTLSANLGLALAGIWYRRGPLPQGIALLEQVLSLELSNREKANVLALLGNYCRHFGQYAFSLSQLREALELFEKLDDKIGIMESTRNLALSYADNGNFQICKAMLSRSHSLVQELNIPYQRILFFKEKGWILSQMGQPEEALSVLQQALNMFPLDHHFMSRSQIHSNIGLIYFRKNNLVQANQHYNKALIYAKHGKVTDRMGLVSLNIALCSILSGENHVAEQAFQEGAKQLKQIKNYRGLATLQANLSLFRLTNGKLDAAREYAKRARTLCKRFPHPVTEYLLAFVHTFLHISKRDYQKAYQEISFAKDLINSKQVLYKYTECYAVCVEVLVRMNNIEQAQTHFDALLKKISNSEPSHLFLKSYAEYWLCTGKSSKEQCQEKIDNMFAFTKKHLPNRPDISFLIENAQRDLSDLPA